MVKWTKYIREVRDLGKCIIFCAAACDSLAAPIETDDYVIAADGGLIHTEHLGITPDEILGDFDSLGYTPTGSRVFPTEKDDTDAMLAIRRGLSLGYREFLIYGGLDGPRLDHTVANFGALQFLAEHGARGYLIGLTTLVTILKNGTLRFDGSCEGTISVFCHGRDAHGVTLENLYYPLDNKTLTADFPIGVSNHFTKKSASITVKDGSLLILWDRKNGFPEPISQLYTQEARYVPKETERT